MSPASARAGCAPSSRRPPSRGCDGPGRPVLPGRGRAAALPLGRGAARARPRPALGSGERGRRGQQRRASGRGRRSPATVLDAAQDRHLLVVLDDLHWADTSTLRVLRLLAETADAGRLLVVCDLAAPACADRAARGGGRDAGPAARPAPRADRPHRRGGRRDRHLGGRRRRRPTSEADALRLRTDGNPFFLVEYARLAREGGDLTRSWPRRTHRPRSSDVLTRRFAALPESTGTALRHAARDRPPVRRTDPRGGARCRRGRRARRPRRGSCRRAGRVRTGWTGCGSPTRWSATRCTPDSRAAPWPDARSRGRGARRHGRPRERGGPALAGRRSASTLPRPGGPGSWPPRPRAGSSLTRRRSSC